MSQIRPSDRRDTSGARRAPNPTITPLRCFARLAAVQAICSLPSRQPNAAYLGHTGAMGNGSKPTDRDTLAHIRDLVAEEKHLRAQLQHRDITESEEHERLRRVEVELDQCWDLL